MLKLGDILKRFMRLAKILKVSLKSQSKNFSSIKSGDIIAFKYDIDETETLVRSQKIANVPTVPETAVEGEKVSHSRIRRSAPFRFFSQIKQNRKRVKQEQVEKKARWERALLRRPIRIVLVIGGFVHRSTGNKLVACFVLNEEGESKVNSIVLQGVVNNLYKKEDIVNSERVLQGLKSLFSAEDYRTFNLQKMANIQDINIKELARDGDDVFETRLRQK